MRVDKKFFDSFVLPDPVLRIPRDPEFRRAQQQEKRIALVVGDGAYAKSPLATAANDAGLIAQTLQAAGFDVVGAVTSTADTLRRSFAGLHPESRSLRSDTVVRWCISRATECSWPARIIHTRRLHGQSRYRHSNGGNAGSTGLRPSACIASAEGRRRRADAARQQPFVEGGQPLASGLALVEPMRIC